MIGHNINEGVEDTTSPEVYLNATVDSGEPYSLDYPNLLVNSTAIAGPMTAGMYVYTAAPTREIRFYYNADGLRTRKETTLGGRVVETTDYTLHGKLVTEMRRGSDVLHFFYDAQSRPAMVKYNGQMYTYVHNLQGDIVAIVDKVGPLITTNLKKNEITTLGRGGSDMTAIALAGALSAQACEIYSDVDGVYTADPKVVLSAQKLDELSSAEMLEMAQHGAKVLHDEAILYAHKHQIALYAKKSHDPTSTGTFIRPDGWPDYALEQAALRPLAILTPKKAIYVSLDIPSVSAWLDTLRKIDGIQIMDMAVSGHRVEALIDIWNCPDEDALRTAISQNAQGSIRTDIKNVTAVGHDLGRFPDILAKFQDMLADAGVETVAIFIQPNAVTFVIPTPQVATASDILHACIKK